MIDIDKLRALLAAGTKTAPDDSHDHLPSVALPLHVAMFVMNGRSHVSSIHDATGECVVETDAGTYPPHLNVAELLCAAVNALPQLLAIAEAAMAYRDASVDDANYSAVREFAANMALIAAVDAARKAGS